MLTNTLTISPMPDDCGGIQRPVVFVLQEMAEEEKYTCPVCTRALQKRQRQEQRRIEAEAAAEIEREAREAQAARKAKLVSIHMKERKERKVCDIRRHDGSLCTQKQ